jgi:YesN/AraC family two-component response regulator
MIATNTSLQAHQIKVAVSEIKTILPHIHTIVLSGYYSPEFVTDLKQEGIDRFLPLPFNEAALLEDVKACIRTP